VVHQRRRLAVLVLRVAGGRLTSAATASSVADGLRAVPQRPNGSARSSSAPRLEFSTERLDLGDGKPNEILRGELTLINRGTKPAKFTLVKHCGCTELSPLTGDLGPGASLNIHVGLQLAGYANSEKNTSVEAQTAHPATIVARCVVSARCPAPFRVTPAFISFGSLSANELAGASAEVRVDSVAGQPPVVAETLALDHASDAFRVERLSSGPRGSALLRVSFASNVPPGDVHDTLALRSPGSDQVMRVALHARVVEAVSVVPASVSIRNESGGQAFRPVQLLVLCRAGREQLGNILLAEGPPGVQIDDLGALGAASSGRRRIRLSISGDISRWPEKSDVWLRAEGADTRFGFKVSKPSS
jgi:hypothetical protein